jgi:hypothetical protein
MQSRGASLEQTRRIKTWVREVFRLDAEATILVAELACSEPGCPPLETVISVLGAAPARRALKIHRALTDVTRADVQALEEGDDHGHEQA